MASSMKLVITCKCTDDKEHQFSWKYSKEVPRETDVKALASALVTNGSIFEYVPAQATGAKIIVTTEDEIDISE